MSREQLENVAKELNIKNIKSLDNERLGYSILDAQAAIEAAKPIVEKPIRLNPRARAQEALIMLLRQTISQRASQRSARAQRPNPRKRLRRRQVKTR